MKIIILGFGVALVLCTIAPMSGRTHRGEPASRGTAQFDSSAQISLHIQTILQDKKGNFWFGTDGDGVCRYDGKSFTYFTVKDGLCSNYIRKIVEDQSGNLWFATRDGICRYDGMSFRNFSLQEDLPTYGFAATLRHREAVDIWFGTRDGAYHYNGITFSYLSLPMAAADVKRRKDQPGYNGSEYSVYCTLADPAGNLWFGTEQRGVCRYDGASFTWFADNGLMGNPVRAMFQDKSGTIWFATNGAGLIRYDGKAFSNFTDDKGLNNKDFRKTLKGKPGTLARVWTIAEDNAGNLWFGTIDAGVWRYDGKSLRNFTVEDGLTSNAVWSIYKDSSGALWFGTDGGGVCRFDGKKFVNFTKKDRM
ncbi:MAG TPA: two-component regulator propeller domain-containing protein [Bacteroidota bacterium]|nr:two-component regulator propeller domain-containing protein [Bacteroidota bacterium]